MLKMVPSQARGSRVARALQQVRNWSPGLALTVSLLLGAVLGQSVAEVRDAGGAEVHRRPRRSDESGINQAAIARKAAQGGAQERDRNGVASRGGGHTSSSIRWPGPSCAAHGSQRRSTRSIRAKSMRSASSPQTSATRWIHRLRLVDRLSDLRHCQPAGGGVEGRAVKDGPAGEG